MKKEVQKVVQFTRDESVFIANDGKKFDNAFSCIDYEARNTLRKAVAERHLIDLGNNSLPYTDDYDITDNYAYDWYKVVDKQGYEALNAWLHIVYTDYHFEPMDIECGEFPVVDPDETAEHTICLEHRYDDYDYVTWSTLQDSMDNMKGMLNSFGYACEIKKKVKE